MTWFKVDDQFHSHPKVTATSLAARGLWVTAGSWSSAHLTDGVVPDHVLALLGGTQQQAAELVTAGLWTRTRGGHRFHDWLDHNPTRQEETTRKQNQSSGGAIGNHRRWHVARGVSDERCRYCQPKRASPTDRPPDRVSDGGTESGANPPARPDPSLRGTGRREGHPTRARDPEPPTRCPQHANHPDPPPCGKCAEARKTHDRWQTDQPTPNRLTGSPDWDTIARNATPGDRRTQHVAAARAALTKETDHAT